MNKAGTDRKDHAALGTVIGIAGIVPGGAAAILFGVYGAAAAVLLGAVALILGIRARQHGRGTGAIVAGVLSVIVAVTITVMVIGTIGVLHEQALKMENAPLVAQCMDAPQTGLVGVVMRVPADRTQEFSDQVRLVMDALSRSGGTGTADSAPE